MAYASPQGSESGPQISQYNILLSSMPPRLIAASGAVKVGGKSYNFNMGLFKQPLLSNQITLVNNMRRERYPLSALTLRTHQSSSFMAVNKIGLISTGVL